MNPLKKLMKMLMTVVKMVLKTMKDLLKSIKTPMGMIFLGFSILFVVLLFSIKRSPEQFTQDQAEPLNSINNKTATF